MRLCRTGDRSIAQVASNLDLDFVEAALRDWVKRADIDAGNGPPEGPCCFSQAPASRAPERARSDLGLAELVRLKQRP